MGLGAQDILARLVSYDVVIENEIVLGGDRDPVERGIRGIEAGIEDPHANTGPVDPGVGERPQMQLAVWHLGGAQHRIVARRDTAGVPRSCAGRGNDAWCGQRAPQLEASERLNALQITVFEEPAQGGRRHIGADGVQPAALDADPCPERRDARADRIERSRWAREQPDRNCGVLHATEQARQDWGNGWPLRGQPSRQENEPDEPPDHSGLGARG